MSRAPRPPGAGQFLAESVPGDEAGQSSSCAVLTHPAFDRPAVQNERRRGPKRGTVNLAVKRRRRDAEAAADERRRAVSRAPAHDVLRELVGGCLERDLINAALAFLDRALRRPDVVFDSPQQVREFLTLHLAPREREAFAVLFLDGQHSLIEFAVLFEGTLTQAMVYPREVVRHAMKVNAHAVILAHNHPSGNPEPSRQDELVTASLKAALDLVNVRVLDHLIVGRLNVVSMVERGLV